MNVTSVAPFSAQGARRTPASPAPKTAARTPQRGGRDRVELSRGDVLSAEREGYIEAGGNRFAVTEEMAAKLRETYEKLQARAQARLARQTAREEAQSAREQAEAAKKEADSMAKAMEIARRIARGGVVPSEDEQFLLEFSQEMYMAAKMQAAMAREHEKYESVLEDEEESAEAVEGTGAEGAERLEASLSDGAAEAVAVETGEK